MPEVGSAWYELTARTSKLRGALDDADRRVSGSVRNAETGFGRRVTGAIGRMGGAFSAVVRTGAMVGGVAAVGLGAVAGLAIKGAADAETMRVQWEVLLGSVDKANERMKELTEFAASTPFEVPEVMAASRQLEIFGGPLLSTGDNLRMVGDIASGVGQPFTDVATWVGRMYDAVKNGQPFGEASARLTEMGAIGGKSRREIEKIAESVKSGEMTMGEAWKKIGGEFGQFGGMMEKQSKTAAGQWSNLQDNIGQTLVGIGEILLPFAKDLIGGMNEALPSIKETLITVFEVAGPIIKTVVGTISEVISGLISFIVENWPAISETIGTVIGIATDVIESFVAALTPLFRYIVSDVIPPLIEVFQAVASWVTQNWPMISNLIGSAVGLIIDVFKLLWPIIENGARIILPILGVAFSVLGPILTTIIDVLRLVVQAFTKDFLPVIEGVARTFSEVWVAVSTFFSEIWNGMLQVLGSVVAGIVHIIGEVVGVAAGIPGPWQEGAKEQKAALDQMEADAKTWGTETTNTLETSFDEQYRLAKTGGRDTARGYADAFAAQGDYFAERVGYFGSKGSRLLETFSPPKHGPLKGIDKWGAATADAYAEGFASRAAALRATIGDTLSGYSGRARAGTGALSQAPRGIGGGSVTVNANFNSVIPYSGAQARAAARAFIPALVPELRRQRVMG